MPGPIKAESSIKPEDALSITKKEIVERRTVLTPVDVIYRQLLRQGYTKKQAATIAQKKTGLSLVTGRPIKRGQYGG